VRDRRPPSTIPRARLQLAHLPFVKNFDQFDFVFHPSIDERQIPEPRALRFIHEASDVIFPGPRVGKTHLSVRSQKPQFRPDAAHTS
jgi:DNA replication protein DnaC